MRRSGNPGLFVSLYNWHNPKVNTSGGAPYGVTWEEKGLKHWEVLEEKEDIEAQKYDAGMILWYSKI